MGVAREGVTIERVDIVLPAEPLGKKTEVFLSSCDLVCRSYPYINRIFFFDCKAAPQESAAAVQVLKEGLARALVSFYPLSGRLGTNKNGRLQVVCEEDGSSSNAGAEFVEAACELPFSLLAQSGFQYHQVFWELARRTRYLRCDHLHEPILSVQVTQFIDGDGYSVGVSMSHAVGDAQAFYDFVYCWGEVCRGLAMSIPPLHMRNALSVSALFPKERLPSSEVASSEIPNGCNGKSNISTCSPDRLDEFRTTLPPSNVVPNGSTVVTELVKQLEHMDLLDESTALGLTGQNLPTATRTQAPIMEKQMEEEEHRQPRTDLVQKVFSFSLEKLQILKRKANVEVFGDATETLAKMHDDLQHGFTTFESFCAHWWQCLIRARRLPPTQMVSLLIPINCRQRFLNLPHSYFGNALDGALAKVTASELCEADLNIVASKIHDAIMAVTENGFKQYIKSVESKGNAISHFDRRGLFHVVDSPKYPIYNIDFGFGNPQAVRAEGFRFGAEVQILAGRNGRGSYDLFCALDADVMQRLEQDDAFLGC